MLWNTLNLFFTSSLNGGTSPSGEPGANSEFPQGKLTSAPWEGWWDSPTQA
jgi:hypothetical protein